MSVTSEERLKMEKVARALGWADLDQMLYYEQMTEKEYLLQVQNLAEAPPTIYTPHELDKIQCEEAYRDGFYAGVY